MTPVTDEEVRQAFREVFETPQGRVVWLNLLHKFGFMDKTTMGRTPEETYANEGARCVVLHIHAMVNGVSPEQQIEAEQ